MTIVDSLDRACRRLDETRACLRWADAVESLGSDSERRAARELRGASFVATCGVVEQFFREFAEWLCDEIECSGTPLHDVRLSLHSIVGADDFRSLQGLRASDKMYERRIAVLERTAAADICTFQLRHDELGLSGETIRPAHVSNLWSIFGLPGSGFANVRQQVALRVFADNRNDYAHGKVDIATFLANPECAIAQLMLRIDDLEEWCFHCWNSGDGYLATHRYRR